MSGILERAAEFFLAPAAPPATTTLPPAVRAVVLGSEPDVVPLAAAVALSFRVGARPPAEAFGVGARPSAASLDVGAWPPAASLDAGERPSAASLDVGARPPAPAAALPFRGGVRAPVAVVACWPGVAMKPSAATRAAATLARRLAADEVPAVARGRLTWLALPDEPAAAAAAVRRASALADGPLVTALGGARPPDLESLVAEHDLAIVAAAPDTALARAAVARLTDRGVPATAWSPIRRGFTRTLALAGVAAPRIAVGGGLARQ